jgi:hypothetical protein
MKKIFSSLFIITLLISCSKNKTGSMVVNGNIDGLKKGTVYLQKYKDTLLVSVDSVQLNGLNTFVLVDELESPEIYFITLDKKADERITFFGEKGELTVNSKLDKFSTSAKITGSKNQEKLEEFNDIYRQFNSKQLDFIKEKFEATKINDTAALSNIEKNEANLIKRKYYYTTNFSIQNADKEIAPYIALTELYNANIKLLDTVNNSLTNEIKASKYGVELEKFINDIRKKE